MLTGCWPLLGGTQPHIRYELEQPALEIRLPGFIDEISGIVFKDGRLYAIDDEHGDLFRIGLESDPEIKKWKFAKDADYEGIAWADGVFYVLESNGSLLWFRGDLPVKRTGKKRLPLKGKNEFESLYYDAAARRIILLCKDCKEDKNGVNSAWSFNPATGSFDRFPRYQIAARDIRLPSGTDIGAFRPSAATLHPHTKNLFVLSAVNRVLVELKGVQVVTTYPLPPRLFPQPEGIAFSPSGVLYIASEASGGKPASVRAFKPINHQP